MVHKAMHNLIDAAVAAGSSVLLYAVFQSPNLPETSPVSDSSLFRWAIEQGGLVVALGITFYMYRKDSREWSARLLELLKERDQMNGLIRDQSDQYAELLKNNTIALGNLTRAIDDAQAERFPPARHLRPDHPR